MTEREERLYDTLIELNIATEREIGLALRIMGGSWEDVLNAICFYFTGYSTVDELIEKVYSEEGADA